MPFKSISRHQPSQQEPKLSWPSLTGKYLKNCRYIKIKRPSGVCYPSSSKAATPSSKSEDGVSSYWTVSSATCRMTDSTFRPSHQAWFPLVRMRFSICFSSFEAKLWFRRTAEEFSVQKQTWTTIKKNRNTTVNPLQNSYHYQPVKCLKCLQNICKQSAECL